MGEIIINRMEGQYDVIRPLDTYTDMSFHITNAMDDDIGISFVKDGEIKKRGAYVFIM